MILENYAFKFLSLYDMCGATPHQHVLPRACLCCMIWAVPYPHYHASACHVHPCHRAALYTHPTMLKHGSGIAEGGKKGYDSKKMSARRWQEWAWALSRRGEEYCGGTMVFNVTAAICGSMPRWFRSAHPSWASVARPDPVSTIMGGWAWCNTVWPHEYSGQIAVV